MMITGVKLLDQCVVTDSEGKILYATSGAKDADDQPVLIPDGVPIYPYFIRTIERATGDRELATIWAPNVVNNIVTNSLERITTYDVRSETGERW